MILHATNNDLIIKESERLISGSVKIYTCEFTFDESWDNYVKTVVFSTGGSRLVNVALLDNVCEIPPEVLRPNARVRIGIYGTDGVRSRPTTYSEWINVEQGADVTGNYAEPPTPSVYDQWVAGLDEKHDEWNAQEQARSDAEAERVEAEKAREDLETGYVAQAKEYAEAAKASEEASASSQTAAESAVASAESAATSAMQSEAIAQTSAANALTYAGNAAYSAAQAKASEDTVKASAQNAATSEENARASASAAASSASTAQTAKIGAEAAQAAAEQARDEAQAIAGGDFATPAYVDSKAAAAESNANTYTDRKIAAIPTPDVSDEINAHNDDLLAHAAIRNTMLTTDTEQTITGLKTFTKPYKTDFGGNIVAYSNLAAWSNSAPTGTICISIKGADQLVQLGISYLSYYTMGEITFKGRVMANSAPTQNGAIGKFVGEVPTIRYAKDTEGQACILLGHTNYFWGYWVQMMVTDMYAGITGNNDLSDKVKITLITDESGLSDITEGTIATGVELANFGVTATATEINCLDGATSNIQEQLNSKVTAFHYHDAAWINSGVLNINRIPVVSVEKGGTGANTAATALANLGAAPMYTYGTDDLEAGVTPLETGKLHFVYE